MNQIKIGLQTYQVVQISGYPYQFHNLYEKTTANLSFFGSVSDQNLFLTENNSIFLKSVYLCVRTRKFGPVFPEFRCTNFLGIYRFSGTSF